MNKVIFLELNEVPIEIMEYFVAKVPNSFLAKIYPKLKKYITLTDDVGHLSPWITWPTFHRGVNNELHHIHDFGEDMTEVDKKFPPVWHILNKNGVKCGIFSSLHCSKLPENYQSYSFYVPDPFASEPNTHPQKLSSFQEFNLSMSRQSGRNVSNKFNVKQAFSLLNMFKLSTIADIGTHVVKEQFKKSLVGRRRTYQSVLAFDVFMDLLEQEKPQFTTFFTNHVASAMHRYWAATFPEQYDRETFELGQDWIDTYKDEIDFTMNKTSMFLEKLVAFVDKNPDYTLAIASSMGQKATVAEAMKDQLYLVDIPKFFSKLGFLPTEWQKEPAMLPQYNFKFINEPTAQKLADILSKTTIEDYPIEFRQKDNFVSVDFGHRNLATDEICFNETMQPFENLGLEKVGIDEGADTTAYHIPEGILFTYKAQQGNQNGIGTQTIPSKVVAPSLLAHFGIPAPEYMLQTEHITF